MPTEDPLLLFQSRAVKLDRGWLRSFAERLRAEVAGGACFSALLTSDRRLRQLNRDFRGKDEPTDVLSFPLPTPDGSLGEMAISVPRAREQAEALGHPAEREIAILLLHGLLHLLGHDHEADRGAMRRLETRWRRRLGLPPGLIERTRAR
ncbi:MAG: rRNA maturation RNase YbeY [Bryobacteraceae bacterium]|nr:rRNA maturation RNase YbeY [Bryobacteraceae bacterium]